MKKDLVSIILPIYNGEKYLRNTIQQILASEYANIELILINDGSKDSSHMICEEFLQMDPRIIYYAKENGGVVSARNKGLELAHGDYICFADQDDIIDQSLYRILLEDCKSSECDIAISNVATYDENTHETHLLDDIRRSELISDKNKDSLLQYIVMGMPYEDYPYKVHTTIWNCMFSAKLIEDNHLHFISIVANEDDWIFLTKAVECAERIYLDHRCLYQWRIHSGQTTYRYRYIIDLPERRKRHWFFVKPYVRRASRAVQEEYKVLHFTKTLYEVLVNEGCHLKEPIHSRNRNVKQAILNESRLFGKISKLDIFRRAWKDYGLCRSIFVMMAFTRFSGIPIRILDRIYRIRRKR